MTIVIRDLCKRFRTERGVLTAVDRVSLEIGQHEFFTLLGPSGCGKTTLLRCIAGLETPDDGEIRIDDHLVFSSTQGVNVPPNRRNVGMVFQSYAVWPHMTVFDNIAFPLRVRRIRDIESRVDAALSIVGMQELRDRFASRLSGGQQQRVAFARAIVGQPAVLLLDEPLSNLDTGLKDQMRRELRALQERLAIATVLVTHDQVEALSLSRRIAVMRDGAVSQVGAPADLYARPDSLFVAGFLGGANVLTVRTYATDPAMGRTTLETPLGPLVVTGELPGDDVAAVIRPEHIALLQPIDDPAQHVNRIVCRVRSVAFLGEFAEVILEPEGQANDTTLTAHVPATTTVIRQDTVTAVIDPARVILVRKSVEVAC